jgi:hypothetical protein
MGSAAARVFACPAALLEGLGCAPGRVVLSVVGFSLKDCALGSAAFEPEVEIGEAEWLTCSV